MNTTTLTPVLNFYGFYELDSHGQIVYARFGYDGKFQKADRSVIGRDFFSEIFGCRNSEALRRRFHVFVTGRLTTDTFIFGGELDEKVIPLRILLVRVAERDTGERGDLFYLDIKPH